ncbi:MAG: LytR C-terminal domain-containing protein [bacterium]
MLDLIEKIGPFVGLAAFVGLAILAFVIFQQSRDVRRLREWAGRAPERAAAAAAASAAAAEARGAPAAEERPGRLARLRSAIAGAVAPRYQAFDRRSPIDGRIVLGVLGAAVVAAGVLTSGFGLVGGDDGGGKGSRAERKAQKREQKPKIAVLNATQTSTGVQGVPGLAKKVATEVVKPAGYEIGAQANAPTGFAETIVMFEPKAQGDAAEFARAVESELGETPAEPIAADIRALAGESPLVLVIGADDAGF